MRTIADAAARLSKKQLSPVELTQAVLARVDALNPKIGAYITVAASQAMDAARVAEREIQQGRYRGPLHGIPVAVKDTYYTKGIRTTAASPVLKDFVPEFDCTIVERLKSAGAILIGKLNLPEFSFGGYTPGCHNPWDLTRNPGGSSGGSGAALAASMVLGAPGGDTSGSIRNPCKHLRRRGAQADVRIGQPLWRRADQLDARSPRADGEHRRGHRHLC